MEFQIDVLDELSTQLDERHFCTVCEGTGQVTSCRGNENQCTSCNGEGTVIPHEVQGFIDRLRELLK